jgi:S1-C subfamily serine protease
MHRLLLVAILGSTPARPATAEPVRPSSSVAGSERSKVVREAMPRSVRVQVVVRGDVRRTGSGVVVSVDGAAPADRSLIVTNAHVVDPSGLSSPVYQVLVERQGRVERTLPARLLGLGRVPETDLAVLEVDASLPAAILADEREVDLGDDLVVVGAPYGRSLSVSGGMLSQLEAEPGEAGEAPRFKAMKTDAAIGYGSSGGGVFSVPGGRLVGIVEGYRTARVAIDDAKSFDVPMPGETFVAPVTKVRKFLAEKLAERAARESKEAGASVRSAPAAALPAVGR